MIYSSRQSGRTQHMINGLIEAISEGSPDNVVFGHSHSFTKQHLFPRVLNALEANGMEYEVTGEGQIQVIHTIKDKVEKIIHDISTNGKKEYSKILFMSTKDDPNRLRGWKASHFVDHYCRDEYREMFKNDYYNYEYDYGQIRAKYEPPKVGKW